MKKFSIIIVLSLLISGCTKEKFKNMIITEELENIKFEQIWNELGLGYNLLINEDLELLVDKHYNVTKIEFRIISENNNFFESQKIVIYPADDKVVFGEKIQIEEPNETNIVGSQVMKILDRVNLYRYIKDIEKNVSFYHLSCRIRREDFSIQQTNELGKLMGEEEDLETGITYKNIYENKHVVITDGIEKQLKYKEEYKFDTDVLEIIIVPMEKAKDNSYRGSIEWTLYYTII